MSVPRSNSRSSTCRSGSGYRMNIITARQITSGELLNYRKRFRFAGDHRPPRPGSSQSTLTPPRDTLRQIVTCGHVIGSRNTKLCNRIVAQRDAEAGHGRRRQYTVDEQEVLDRQISTQPGIGEFFGQTLDERTIAGDNRQMQGCGDTDGRLPAMGHHDDATIARLAPRGR